MADNEHLGRLREGVAAWNDGRRGSGRSADLSGADLSNARLNGANLRDVYLRDADLRDAELTEAILIEANLSNANLGSANLRGADMRGADLRASRLGAAQLEGACLQRANLGGADLNYADLSGANLSDANLAGASLAGANLNKAVLNGAVLCETVIANVDLSSTSGLEACEHAGPSIVDLRTITKSGSLPLIFLRGVGLPDNVIEYLPSLLGQPIQYYSCFISYSTMDDDFATRIHADLQSKGVRCWFAPHDLSIGGKILDEIDAAIRLRDKVLLILSARSIESGWVEDEVKTAYEEERRRKQTMLFPIRLDDVVMETGEAWASKLRADRNIGDFRQWKKHDCYEKVFKRVLRDLTAGPKKSG